MANVALNKYADASNSMFPYQPAKAVDGISTPLNRWVGSSPLPPSPVWLRVDLGATYWINRWVLRQMGAVGWSPNYNLSDYKLQGSLDNVNWFDIDTVTNNSANSTDRPISPVKTRWVRIYVTKGLRCNNNFASIVDLEIYQADPTSAKLTGLAISTGTLSPPFDGTTYAYSANVGYDNSTITVTATTEDSRATIKVNGVPATSGQPSAPVSLDVGSNTVTVEVTPFIGDPQNYVITVTRASSPYLSNITGIPNMTPAFDKNTFNYTATVSSTTSTIKLTPTAEDSNAGITVNGSPVTSGEKITINLATGLNNIVVIVTSITGTDSRTYNFAVTKQQS